MLLYFPVTSLSLHTHRHTLKEGEKKDPHVFIFRGFWLTALPAGTMTESNEREWAGHGKNTEHEE